MWRLAVTLEGRPELDSDLMHLRWSEEHALRAAAFSVRRLQQCGIEVPASSRLHAARSCIERNRGRAVIDIDTHIDLSERLLEAHRSVMELYCIASALQGSDDSFTAVVPKALTGNELVREDRNPEGRNFQFEVLTAALLRLAGIHGVELAEPDIRITAGDSAIGVAAKRITSLDQRKREKHLTKANKQLRRQGLGGIVALNLDAVVTDTFLQHGHDRALRLLSDITEESRRYLDRINTRPGAKTAAGSAEGVISFATLLCWDTTVTPAELRLDVSCHAALSTPESMHQKTRELFTGRGRYLVDTLTALVARLEHEA